MFTVFCVNPKWSTRLLLLYPFTTISATKAFPHCSRSLLLQELDPWELDEMRMRGAERTMHHQRLDEAEAANMLISLGNSRSGTPQFSPTPLQGVQGVSPHPARPQSPPLHMGYHSTGKEPTHQHPHIHTHSTHNTQSLSLSLSLTHTHTWVGYHSTGTNSLSFTHSYTQTQSLFLFSSLFVSLSLTHSYTQTQSLFLFSSLLFVSLSLSHTLARKHTVSLSPLFSLSFFSLALQRE